MIKEGIPLQSHCPYCGEPFDRMDSISRLPNGSRFHFQCGDRAIAEWQPMKEFIRAFGVALSALDSVNDFESEHTKEFILAATAHNLRTIHRMYREYAGEYNRTGDFI